VAEYDAVAPRRRAARRGVLDTAAVPMPAARAGARVVLPPTAGPAPLVPSVGYRVALATEVRRPTGRTLGALLLAGRGIGAWTGGLRQQGRRLLACGRLRPYIGSPCGHGGLAARCRRTRPRGAVGAAPADSLSRPLL
jgi:hypothetical protein